MIRAGIKIANRLHQKHVKVGDEVEEYLTLGICRQQELTRGTVIYVHPEKRFYRVRFDLPGGNVAESFHCFKCRADT